MTKQGRAGEALWIAAVGSFIAGTFGTFMLSFIGPQIAKYAFKFGPPEYFGLMILSLTALVSLSGGSILKGIIVGLLGLILATMGVDPQTGVARLDFGITWLLRGFDIVPLAVGAFGIGEILLNAEAGIVKIYEGKVGRMMPRGKELKKGLWACVRGTLFGWPLGLLPGITPGSISFLAYDFEKKISKYPEKFGTGVIEGVANPESANNATAQAGFLPLLTFGIPTGPSPAIILAALMLFGLKPGPTLFIQNKEFVWTVIGSMYIGNVMLLILNLPLVGLWARISTIPFKYMAPIILGICIIGAYSPRNIMFDVWVALGAGIVAYFMKKKDWPVAPMMLGFILGPMLESSFRQSVSMGGYTIFFTRYLTMAFFLLTVVVIVVSFRFIRRIPKEILEDDSGI
jgi:putative tricarboxylic transport membrane protein